ncbi:hypothetical protein Ae201684P_012647 [Aphanomyces euteiches]|uniref:Uncharacterized protein n=1 Tax=Aphanomyces euteiches TaxID=100861 RepID=A0A6G0WZB8_9STRA|nr:hypothetical protein Ae201684_010187 [Aphanomyces euteiches]KAH9076159.1 hypothetical protein Ae201684P_012647 [Aphanomyces euteiches]
MFVRWIPLGNRDSTTQVSFQKDFIEKSQHCLKPTYRLIARLTNDKTKQLIALIITRLRTMATAIHVVDEATR